ncbi:MAG: HNH endonuclease [Acidobacteriota bacterium]|nr:HNH endonuclease [Acidobacteriota bacterium]
MIKVKRDYRKEPAVLIEVNRKENATGRLADKGNHPFSTSIYRAPEVFEKLIAAYHGKCAYCEGTSTAQAAMQVEHYRPKKEVADDKAHPGYYWLAYEWSNLIPACAKCNRAKAGKFPIQGTRLSTHPEDRKDWRVDASCLLLEAPLLLHPEVDDPAEYLAWSPYGLLKARKGNARGETTITICKLNRDPLVKDRLERANWYRESLQKAATCALEDMAQLKTEKEKQQCLAWYDKWLFSIFEALIHDGAPSRPYSAFFSYLYRRFAKTVLPEIPEGTGREIVRESFSRFQLEHRA